MNFSNHGEDWRCTFEENPTNHSKLVPEALADSVPPYVAAVLPSVSALSTSAGVHHKAKPRKQTTPVSMETPLVFHDFKAAVPEQSPPSKGVVTETESIPPPAKNSPSTRSKATEKGVSTPIPAKKSSPLPKKVAKGFLKRKTPSESTDSARSLTKKRLKDNPPSPNTSENDEEEETMAETSTENLPAKAISDNEPTQDSDGSETESEPMEEEELASSDTDVAPTPPPVVTAPSSVDTKRASKSKGKKLASKSSTPLEKSVVKSKAYSHSFYHNDNDNDNDNE